MNQIEIKIKWINVNLDLNSNEDIYNEKLFYVDNTKYLINYCLILDLDNMNGNYKWELFSEEKGNEMVQINKLPFGLGREVLIYKNSHFMGYFEKKNYQSNKDKKGKNKNKV